MPIQPNIASTRRAMLSFAPHPGDEEPSAGLDLDPGLEQIEQQLSPTFAALLDLAAPLVVGLLLVLALVTLLGALIRHRIAKAPDSPSPGPSALAAALGCALLYLLGRLVDPLLAALLERPSWFPAADWPKVGWFEWKLLGRPWAYGALPMADHPALALVVHALAWLAAWWVLRVVFDLLWTREQRWSRPEHELAFYQRFVGASTTRRSDRRFRRWIAPLVLLALPLHALAGMRLGLHGLPLVQLATPTPLAPGTWVVGGLVLWMLSFSLLVEGKPPAAKRADEPEAEQTLVEVAEPGAPLERLRSALELLRPGVRLEPLEQRPADAGARSDFPTSVAPLVREIFTDLTGEARPWAHQAELLEHLGELWRVAAGRERGEVPSLAEERGPVGVRTRDDASVHALMLAPEGSGRTTTTLLAALHVFLDRGATSLVIVRDRASAKQWSRRLEQALLGSSARWNVLVCVAGESLAGTLMAERTPAIVVTDLETCEAELLADPRTDAFLARLGLVVADDVDAFTGVAEMHLQLCMRRLWALLDRLHEAAYPVALLATCGAGASGMDAWAKHVLAQPLRVFAGDRAARREQLLLRRRDLVDAAGHDIPLALLAQACDEAGLPWHLRLAGDAHRHVRRANFDLGRLRRHFREDPREAAIVIVEGTHADVRREADRLAHAGLALAPELADAGPLVLVLAPPGDEEMVLHEEAADAPTRELIAGLPRAVALSEPRVVRQRHFDRALGREQDLAALRERFGAGFVDDTVAKLGDSLRTREVLQLDPRSDEIVARTLLRSAREGSLGQPIDAACVGERDSRACLVDAGTSELLGSLDDAIAPALFPPGRVFLHARGRFMVGEPLAAAPRSGDTPRSIQVEQIDGTLRSTLDRSLALELASTPAWSTRELGGRPLAVALVSAGIVERIHGVRRFAPGPKLVDHRVFERPYEARYGSDACLIASGSDPRGHFDVRPAEPSWELLIPLAAALRMILPTYLREAEDALDVDLVEHAEQRLLVIYDRTPGGSGLARFVCERGLGELFALARLVLERLVGPEFERLRHIHDRALHSDPSRWHIADALRWLDSLLERPLADAGARVPGRLGPRVEFVPGESPGDLGRLWISSSGRSDDLVWTRQTWTSSVALGEHAPGRVHFDIAVERPSIATAARARVPASLTLLASASEGERALLELDAAALAPIRERLHAICGAAGIDAVLELVAAIPIVGRPLGPGERRPLTVLMRRRADREAKLLLAAALLPDATAPELVRDGDRAWISLVRGQAGREAWSLEGPSPRRVEDR